MKPLFLLGVAVCLFASGCDDSKNPLSDPQTSKADERLVGVWRGENDDGETYYHVGHAGEKFPSSVMRIVMIEHRKGRVESAEEYFAFATAIGSGTYLNVVLDGDKKLVAGREEKGWKAVEADSYKFFKYQFDGDKLVMWLMDDASKRKAIEGGKVKGGQEPNRPAKFTDTTENVARFVAEAGDSLWDMKDPLRFERVKTEKIAAPKAPRR